MTLNHPPDRNVDKADVGGLSGAEASDNSLAEGRQSKSTGGEAQYIRHRYRLKAARKTLSRPSQLLSSSLGLRRSPPLATPEKVSDQDTRTMFFSRMTPVPRRNPLDEDDDDEVEYSYPSALSLARRYDGAGSSRESAIAVDSLSSDEEIEVARPSKRPRPSTSVPRPGIASMGPPPLPTVSRYSASMGITTLDSPPPASTSASSSSSAATIRPPLPDRLVMFPSVPRSSMGLPISTAPITQTGPGPGSTAFIAAQDRVKLLETELRTANARIAQDRRRKTVDSAHQAEMRGEIGLLKEQVVLLDRERDEEMREKDELREELDRCQRETDRMKREAEENARQIADLNQMLDVYRQGLLDGPRKLEEELAAQSARADQLEARLRSMEVEQGAQEQDGLAPMPTPGPSSRGKIFPSTTRGSSSEVKGTDPTPKPCPTAGAVGLARPPVSTQKAGTGGTAEGPGQALASAAAPSIARIDPISMKECGAAEEKGLQRLAMTGNFHHSKSSEDEQFEKKQVVTKEAVTRKREVTEKETPAEEASKSFREVLGTHSAMNSESEGKGKRGSEGSVSKATTSSLSAVDRIITDILPTPFKSGQAEVYTPILVDEAESSSEGLPLFKRDISDSARVATKQASTHSNNADPNNQKGLALAEWKDESQDSPSRQNVWTPAYAEQFRQPDGYLDIVFERGMIHPIMKDRANNEWTEWSNRVVPGTLADLLPALDDIWDGGEEKWYVRYWEEKKVWSRHELTDKRRFMMTCWNRHCHQYGSIVRSKSKEKFIYMWLDNYGAIMRRARVHLEVVSHLNDLIFSSAASPQAISGIAKHWGRNMRHYRKIKGCPDEIDKYFSDTEEMGRDYLYLPEFEPGGREYEWFEERRKVTGIELYNDKPKSKKRAATSEVNIGLQEERGRGVRRKVRRDALETEAVEIDGRSKRAE